jgi:hypothetical protein
MVSRLKQAAALAVSVLCASVNLTTAFQFFSLWRASNRDNITESEGLAGGWARGLTTLGGLATLYFFTAFAANIVGLVGVIRVRTSPCSAPTHKVALTSPAPLTAESALRALLARLFDRRLCVHDYDDGPRRVCVGTLWGPPQRALRGALAPRRRDDGSRRDWRYARELRAVVPTCGARACGRARCPTPHPRE